MADVNYSVVDFDNLSAVSDGKTLLYTDGQVCKSKNNLNELIQSAVENKLDTTAFSTVSGNFLTAHQSLDGYATETWVNDQGFLTEHQEIPASANWTESYETVTANSGTWNNVSNIKSFTSIAGIEAETSADSLQITNGDNVSITTANKTITISAKDTTYSTADFIAYTHLSNIQTASGYADDWNTNKSNVVLASGYAQNWSDNSATIIASGNSGVSALNTITANSAAWSNGAFVTAALTTGENPVPDIPEPTNKVIYLTKEAGSEIKDPYTEWIYSDKWEIIGETTLDLSDYYTKNETSSKNDLATEFAKKLDSSAAETTYAPLSLTATVNTLTDSSATWNEVTAKVDTSSMSSYYQKSETSAASAISDALELKEDKIFVAIYDSTTFAELETAFNAGKKIVVQLTQGVDVNYAQLVEYFRLPGKESFQFSTSYGAGWIKSYSCTKANGWSETFKSQMQPALSFGYDSYNAISSINNSAIAAGGSNYTAGTDIKIENDTISVNNLDCSAVTNNYSVAIGLSTSALSYGSFTQGENTLANIGRAAHAEGNGTQALGNYSHSEGSNTSATGEDSHSEGYYTIATERYSHAEGRGTSAQGEDSHAEGYFTSAVGKNAHSEGESSKAKGETSHSEGYDTSAIGNYSHAEGYQTIANSNYSHSEGQETSAMGIGSHAEGYRTKAGSMYMHVCGKFNQTSSNALFVVGNGNANNSRSDAFIIDLAGNVTASGNMFTSAGQVVTDVMLTSATNSTTSFVSSGIADLTPLYTYIKSLEDRIAALEAGTATTPIVNGYNPTVNGDIPII